MDSRTAQAQYEASRPSTGWTGLGYSAKWQPQAVEHARSIQHVSEGRLQRLAHTEISCAVRRLPGQPHASTPDAQAILIALHVFLLFFGGRSLTCPPILRNRGDIKVPGLEYPLDLTFCMPSQHHAIGLQTGCMVTVLAPVVEAARLPRVCPMALGYGLPPCNYNTFTVMDALWPQPCLLGVHEAHKRACGALEGPGD